MGMGTWDMGFPVPSESCPYVMSVSPCAVGVLFLSHAVSHPSAMPMSPCAIGVPLCHVRFVLCRVGSCPGALWCLLCRGGVLPCPMPVSPHATGVPSVCHARVPLCHQAPVPTASVSPMPSLPHPRAMQGVTIVQGEVPPHPPLVRLSVHPPPRPR